MSNHRYDTFRALLVQQRHEALTESSKVDQGEINAVSEDMSDVADRSSLESDRNFTLRLLDRDRKLIKKIDEAIERIDEGSFGLCEECGEDIGEERLRARPVTTLCIECKQESEAEEKRTH
jgi:DnaK suppressor protein